MTTTATTASPFTAPAADAVSATRDRFERYLQALSARGDYASYFRDDVTLTIYGGPEASGREAVNQVIYAIHAQMFDSEVRVRRTICEAEHAAAELQFVGTHTGEFAGVPASGRPVDVPYTAAYDFAPDGLITGIRVYLPMQILMGQISG